MEIRKIQEIDNSWLITLNELTSKSNYRKGSDWSKHKSFKEDIQMFLDVKLAQNGFNTDQWLFKEKKVEERPSVVIALCGYTMLDSDNALKSIQDCFEGIFYHTDASVRGTSSLTVRKKTSDKSPVYIGVSKVGTNKSMPEIFTAHTNLSNLVFEHFLKN